jgi:hypothetical protein
MRIDASPPVRHLASGMFMRAIMVGLFVNAFDRSFARISRTTSRHSPYRGESD